MDLLGWIAAVLMLCTFACRDIVALRVLAVGASAAFIAWGLSAGLMPVLVLHAILLPVNVKRLVDVLARRRDESRQARDRAAATDAAAAVPDPWPSGCRSPRDAEDPACVCLASPGR